MVSIFMRKINHLMLQINDKEISSFSEGKSKMKKKRCFKLLKLNLPEVMQDTRILKSLSLLSKVNSNYELC